MTAHHEDPVRAHPCATETCLAIIEAGLKLKFCPDCRRRQPIPTRKTRHPSKKESV